MHHDAIHETCLCGTTDLTHAVTQCHLVCETIITGTAIVSLMPRPLDPQ